MHSRAERPYGRWPFPLETKMIYTQRISLKYFFKYMCQLSMKISSFRILNLPTLLSSLSAKTNFEAYDSHPHMHPVHLFILTATKSGINPQNLIDIGNINPLSTELIIQKGCK